MKKVLDIFLKTCYNNSKEVEDHYMTIRNLKSIDQLTHPADRRLKHYRKRTHLISDSQRLLESTRTSATTRGIEHTITTADIKIPTHCPVFGTRLDTGRNAPEASKMAVDRINNKLGYIPGNVRVISQRANRIKADATVEEMRRLLAYMEENE